MAISEPITTMLTNLILLILPVLMIFGMIYITKFSFSSTASPPTTTEGLKFQEFSKDEQIYSIQLKKWEMLVVQITTILIWVNILLAILSWLGQAYGLWCFP